MSDLGPAEDVRGIAQLSDAALEHIRKPAKSGTLLAYYSDHLELPLGPKHRFPDTKYAKNREQLMADPELQGLIEYREVTCGQHLMAPDRWCQTSGRGPTKCGANSTTENPWQLLQLSFCCCVLPAATGRPFDARPCDESSLAAPEPPAYLPACSAGKHLSPVTPACRACTLPAAIITFHASVYPMQTRSPSLRPFPVMAALPQCMHLLVPPACPQGGPCSLCRPSRSLCPTACAGIIPKTPLHEKRCCPICLLTHPPCAAGRPLQPQYRSCSMCTRQSMSPGSTAAS